MHNSSNHSLEEVREIQIAPYQFRSRTPLNSRSLEQKEHPGMLLRFHFKDGKVGYGNLHPWESLGDLPLRDQVDLLKNGVLTNLTKQSLKLARSDAEARSEKRSLFDGLAIPKSHCTSPILLRPKGDALWAAFQDLHDTLHEEGFDRLKLKVNAEAIEFLLARGAQLEELHPEIKWRLDCNGSLNPADAKKLAKKITTSLKKRVEFIEDPCPFDEGAWKALAESFQLAADQIGKEESRDLAAIHVIKPAGEEYEPYWTAPAPEVRYVVTSYMDHPIGQMASAYIAALFQKKSPDRLLACGLLTHHLYENNAYSDRIHSQGPQLRAPEGNGFGFDDLLEKEDWKALQEYD